MKHRMKLTKYTALCHDFSLNTVSELRDAKYLKKLTLYIEKTAYTQCREKILPFKKAILSMKNLDSLAIIPQDSPFSSQKRNKILEDCGRTMTRLKHVLFVLPYFQVLTPFLLGLSKFISEHPSIESVTIRYEGEEFSEQDHYIVVKAASGLKKLKYINVTFNWCNITPSEKILELVKEYRYSEIRGVSFNLLNTHILPQQLTSMLQGITLSFTPKQFAMNILNCQTFFQEQFDQLSSSILYFNGLEDLTLRIAPYYLVSQSEIEKFYTALDHHTSLASLTLEIKPKMGNMGDYDLQLLGGKLKHLTNLRKLELVYDMNYDISDNGCIAILNGVSELKSLEALTLSMERQGAVTDRSIRALKDTFSGLNRLKNLDLKFCKCGLTNDSLQGLYEGITKLSSLDILSLKISSNKIDNKALIPLRKLLSELSQLSEFCLGLPFSFNAEDCRTLYTGLSSLKSLRVLKLKINTNHSDKLKDGIKRLPRLKEIYWELSSHIGKLYEEEIYQSAKNLEFISWDEIN